MKHTAIATPATGLPDPQLVRRFAFSVVRGSLHAAVVLAASLALFLLFLLWSLLQLVDEG
jgi:hypothetical protein